MADFAPSHQEKLPAPVRVKVSIYDPKVGHVGVATSSHADDDRVGVLDQGKEKVPTPVYAGNAIIEYPGYIYAVMPAENVSAYFEPLAPDFKAPALPEKTQDADLGELLKEAP